MPKVSPISFDVKSLILGPADRGQGVSASAPGLSQQRSAGLHLSQIYGDLTERQRAREAGSKGTMSEPELEMYRSGGFIWETIWGSAMAEAFRHNEVFRPGEFKLDGIAGSPDNIRLDPWRVIETKATWKSVNKWDKFPIEKWFWVWTVQLMGYCKMIRTMEAELYVMFVNGDYKGGGPQTRAVLIEFTKFELEENWSMLTGHARRRGWL